MEPNPNTACEHGHQRRKCPHCEIVQLEAELAKCKETLTLVLGFCVDFRQTQADWESHPEVGVLFAKVDAALAEKE